jgi:hypothetical protein
MVLTREEREVLLRKEWEVSRSEIAAAIRETLRIKHQRRHTVQNLSKESVEVLMERATQGIRRSLLFQSSTSHELQRLEQQYLAAQAAQANAIMRSLVTDEEPVPNAIMQSPEPAEEPGQLHRPPTITINEDEGVMFNAEGEEGEGDDDDLPLTLEDEAEFAQGRGPHPRASEGGDIRSAALERQNEGQITAEAPHLTEV